MAIFHSICIKKEALYFLYFKISRDKNDFSFPYYVLFFKNVEKNSYISAYMQKVKTNKCNLRDLRNVSDLSFSYYGL